MTSRGVIDRVVAVPVKAGGFMESQRGIQRRNPTIFCRLLAPDAPCDTLSC